MIREFRIQRLNGTVLFSQIYAAIHDIDTLSMYKTLSTAAQRLKEGDIEKTDIVRYRFIYSRRGEIIYYAILDRANTDEEADRIVIELEDKFLEKFQATVDILTQEQASSFSEDAKAIVRSLPVKLSFAGFGGVGKTTMTKLLRQEEVPLEYIPTIFGSRRPLTVAMGDYSVIIFDFAGQERFMAAWDILVKGTEVVLIVTDSTYGNIQRTKDEILPLIVGKAPNAKIFVIANKQDLGGVISTQEISRILGYRTFSMIAIDPKNREILLKIIQEAIFA